MNKFTVDPINRRFTVKPGVTTVDVAADLYSDAKEDWLSDSSLRKYRFPIRPVGGDGTSPGQTAPSYFFLREGWRVYVDGENIVVALNLYVGQEDGGGSAFIVVNNGTVENKTSDAQTITQGSGVTAQDKIDIITGVLQEDCTNWMHMTDSLADVVWKSRTHAMLAANLEDSSQQMVIDTVDTGYVETFSQFKGGGTATLSTENNNYQYRTIIVTTGTIAGQVRPINTYDGTTKVFTVSPAFTQPLSDGQGFLIV